MPLILLIMPQDYAATVFAILDMFGLGNKAKALYGGQVNVHLEHEPEWKTRQNNQIVLVEHQP